MGIQERKEREKEARREEIINAAEKVFFEKGLVQSTMDEIAETAELSKGTLYLYFKRKEDLYLAIHLRSEVLLYDMFEKAIAEEENPVRQLMRVGEAYYEFFRQHRNYFRTGYVFESPDLQGVFSHDDFEVCVDTGNRIWALLVDIIQRGIDQGMFHKDLVPMEAVVMLWSSNYGMLRVMDRQTGYWNEKMGVNLEGVLRKSNALLMGSMMTKKARKLVPSVLLFEETERQDDVVPADHDAGTH